MAEKNDSDDLKMPEKLTLENFDKFFDELNKRFIEKLSAAFGPGIQEPQSLEERLQLKKINSFDLKGVADYLKKCKNIILINGAGLSTSAGIPDFRSPGSGLYAQMEKLGLPQNVRPEDIFSFDYFQKDPRPFNARMKWFFQLVKDPSLSHYFQSILVQKGKVKRVYTQNIDCLESKAGISEDKLIEGHGNIKNGHCIKCNSKYKFEWMVKTLDKSDLMKCEKCDDGLVRPDIVMFGESMPKEFNQYETDLKDCDCLIVTGTSLKVAPFSNLPKSVPPGCPRILINRDLVGVWQDSYENKEMNYRDVALLGSCDEIYLNLADLLGFRKELDQCVNKDKKSTRLVRNQSPVKTRIVNARKRSPLKSRQTTTTNRPHLSQIKKKL